MKVSLKNGLLTVALTKPELKKLEDALATCELIASLNPIAPQLFACADDAKLELRTLLSLCAKVEPARPLLDNLPCDEKVTGSESPASSDAQNASTPTGAE